MKPAIDSIMVITPMQLSDHLKAMRKRRGMTQGQLAAHLGLSQNRVSHLENHPEGISFRQLLAWCAALNMRINLTQYPAANQVYESEW